LHIFTSGEVKLMVNPMIIIAVLILIGIIVGLVLYFKNKRNKSGIP